MCDQVGLTTTEKSPKSLVTHELLKSAHDSPPAGRSGRGVGREKRNFAPKINEPCPHAVSPTRYTPCIRVAYLRCLLFWIDFQHAVSPYSSNARRSQFNTAD